MVLGCFVLSMIALEVSSQSSDDIQNQAEANVVSDKLEGGVESIEDYLALSPEDELKSLSEEHRTIKEECLTYKTQIDQSIADGKPVDPQLQSDYQQCELDLAEVELDMEEVTAELEQA